MRFLIRPVVVIVSLVAGAVVCAGLLYAYLTLNADRIFHSQARALTQRHVDVRSIRVEFPATLLVEGLAVENVFSCAQARASVDVFSLFGKDVRLHAIELDRPLLVWERSSAAPEQRTTEAAVAPRALPVMVHPRSVLLMHLVIHHGTLKVVNKDETGAISAQVIERIELRANNVPLTDTPARTDLFITASLAKLDMPFIGRSLKVSGWLNWAARDMDAVAQAIDGNGRVGLDAKLVSRQNDMAVFGNVKLGGNGEDKPAATDKAGAIEDAVLGLLTSSMTDIEAGFSFKTKMDRFEIGPVSLSGRITTGLNSEATSGNIVAGLKGVVEEALNPPSVK
jgi:uncharacterized protein involved in outer membrane biogenesis